MAGDEGFEPPITGPEPVALPLGQSPTYIVYCLYGHLIFNVLVPLGTHDNFLGQKTSDSRHLTAWPIPSAQGILSYERRNLQR